jgi:hypothetical protein
MIFFTQVPLNCWNPEKFSLKKLVCSIMIRLMRQILTVSVLMLLSVQIALASELLSASPPPAELGEKDIFKVYYQLFYLIIFSNLYHAIFIISLFIY